MAAPALPATSYTVGWICALTLELQAAKAMLDKQHGLLETQPASDSNYYTLGSIGPHNVVIACLPEYGTSSAAVVATSLESTFPNARFGLLVGIGGGIPSLENDIRLGDIVVSLPNEQGGGVVQYDLGREEVDGFRRVGTLNKPPLLLRNAIQGLRTTKGLPKAIAAMVAAIADDDEDEDDCQDWTHQGQENDVLFAANYTHKASRFHGCDVCIKEAVESPGCILTRTLRRTKNPQIHYGNIGSGNSVVKDAVVRDKIAARDNIICFEMEAAGLMDKFPCLVIRGITDYADSHKNSRWKYYAAAAAAAYGKKLLEAISPDRVVKLEIIKAHLVIPFDRNLDVVYRDDDFHELSEKLPVSGPRRQSAALWGLGGSGKTQIALEFAYRRHFDDEYSVFWVQADNPTKFFQGYKAIAEKAEIPNLERLKNKEIMEAVRNWIEKLPRWLLVLDNADTLRIFGKSKSETSKMAENIDLFPFVPKGNSGMILWTTRDAWIVDNLVGSGQGVNVTNMSASDAQKLFVTLSCHDFDNENNELEVLKELLEQLDHLPLAVSQAATYIRRTSTSITGYVAKLKDQKTRKKLLAKSGPSYQRQSDVPNNVMDTWVISVMEINDMNPLAYGILRAVVFFDNQNIPGSLIQEVGRTIQRWKNGSRRPSILGQCADSESDGGEVFEEDLHPEASNSEEAAVDDWETDNDSEENSSISDDIEIQEAVALLREFSFLRIRREASLNPSKSYVIHKLVQEATYHMPQPDKSDIAAIEFFTAAIKSLEFLFPRTYPFEVPEFEVLLPHALQIPSWRKEVKCKSLMVADLLIRFVQTLNLQRRHREGQEIGELAFRLHCKTLGEKHPDALQSGCYLSKIYMGMTRYLQAEELILRVLQLQKKVLGEKHYDTIRSKELLAYTYCQMGRHAEEEMIKLEVLQLRKEVLGERHLDTLSTQDDLALTYSVQGRHSEAETLVLQVLQLRKEVLGERHPKTIQSQSSLAWTYQRQGRYSEAETMYNQVIQLQKKVLGERHLYTLSSQADLAYTYSVQDRHSEAEKIRSEVLQLRIEELGSRHIDTISSQAGLAQTYHNQGRFLEAEALQVEVLQLQKDVLGDTHIETLEAMTNLAYTYRVQNRFSEAACLQEEVLQRQKETHGERSHITIESMAILALDYKDQDQYSEAEALQVEVLQSRKEVLGDTHMETLEAMTNLAYTYRKQNRFSEAACLQEEVLQRQKETHGKRSQMTIRSMARLALNYKDQGRYSEAEALEVEVLQLRKKVLGDTHPNTINAMAALAYTHYKHDRFSEAACLQEEALHLRKGILGDTHLDTIENMEELAATCRKLDRGSEADALELEAVRLRTERAL